MTMSSLVADVNADLRQQLRDAQSSNENPHTIRLIQSLIRLTNSEIQAAVDDTTFATPNADGRRDPDESETLNLLQRKVDHKHVPDIYGNCTICKQCTHRRVGPNGICQDCNAQVAIPAAVED